MNKKNTKKTESAIIEAIKLAKAINVDQLADEMMMPLIEWCADADGRTQRIFNIINEGLTKKIGQSTIYRCLNKDREKRATPSAGIFLRLMEAWIKLRGADVENVPMPSIYCVANGHEPKRDGLSCKRCECKI